MLQTIKQAKRNSYEEGFTLIELMIVVVIIGILAAIAIPIFMNQQKAAQDAVLKSDVKNMSVAVETWFTKHPGKLHMSTTSDGTISSWNVVKKGAGAPAFRTLGNSEIAPVDFPDVSLSDGTAMGVLSNSLLNDGYCIMASNTGSNYINRVAYLYYDSLVGKVLERSELTEDGSCGRYIVNL